MIFKGPFQIQATVVCTSLFQLYTLHQSHPLRQHSVTDRSSLIVTTVEDSHFNLNSSFYSSVPMASFFRPSLIPWWLNLVPWFWSSVLSKGLGLYILSGSYYAWTWQENTPKSSAFGTWDPRPSNCPFSGTPNRDTKTL